MSDPAHMRNLKHVVEEPTSDCGDPDCELHSPWVIEDEASRLTAIAWYIAGAKAITAQFDEFLQHDLEQYVNTLAMHHKQMREAHSE